MFLIAIYTKYSIVFLYMSRMFTEIVENVLCEGSVDRYVERLIRLSNPKVDEYFDKPLYEIKDLIPDNIYLKYYYTLFPELFDKMINSKLIDYLRVVFLTKFEISHGNGPTNFIRGLARIGIGEIGMFNDYNCGKKIEKLKNIVKYIIENNLQIDGNFDNMTYYQLNRSIYAIIQNDKKEATTTNEAKTVHTKNGYTIIPINSTEEASKYKDYTGGGDGSQKWCICSSQNYFDNYTEDGRRFYFCLKDGFESITPSQKDFKRRPLDSYGLSMIAVNIDKHGELDRVTTRWNHLYYGENHPDLKSKESLEKVLGCNFDQTFLPYTEDEIEKRNGYDLDDFDDFEEKFISIATRFGDRLCNSFSTALYDEFGASIKLQIPHNSDSKVANQEVHDLCIVSYKGKYNIYSFTKRKFLLPTWKAFVSTRFCYRWAIVNDGPSRMTYVSLDGEILPFNAKEITAFNSGLWLAEGIKSNISILEFDNDGAILLIADDDGNLKYRRYHTFEDINNAGFVVFGNGKHNGNNQTIVDCFGNELCECISFHFTYGMISTYGTDCSRLFEEQELGQWVEKFKIETNMFPGYKTFISYLLTSNLCEIRKENIKNRECLRAIYSFNNNKFITDFVTNVTFENRIKDSLNREIVTTNTIYGYCPSDQETLENGETIREFVPKYLISSDGSYCKKFKQIKLGVSKIFICTGEDNSTVILSSNLKEIYKSDKPLSATLKLNDFTDRLVNSENKSALANFDSITEFKYTNFSLAFKDCASFWLGICEDGNKDLIGTFFLSHKLVDKRISVLQDISKVDKFDAFGTIYYLAVKKRNGPWAIYPIDLDKGPIADNIEDYWSILEKDFGGKYFWVLKTTENKEQLFLGTRGLITYPADEVYVNTQGKLTIRLGNKTIEWNSGDIDDFVMRFNSVAENMVHFSLTEIKQMVKEIINEINKKRP